jgi:hypothetical protein
MRTPFGNSTRILSVVVAHLHCAESERLVGVLVARTRAPLARFSDRNFSPAPLRRDQPAARRDGAPSKRPYAAASASDKNSTGTRAR